MHQSSSTRYTHYSLLLYFWLKPQVRLSLLFGLARGMVGRVFCVRIPKRRRDSLCPPPPPLCKISAYSPVHNMLVFLWHHVAISDTQHFKLSFLRLVNQHLWLFPRTTTTTEHSSVSEIDRQSMKLIPRLWQNLLTDHN